MQIKQHSHSPAGFSLIELLAALAVIIILGTLVFTAVRSTVKKSQQIASASNLRSIGEAFHLYVTDNQGYIPGATQNTPFIIDSMADENKNANASLYRDLTPYLSESEKVWRDPGDEVFYHQYASGKATSYAHALGSFQVTPNGIRFVVGQTPAVELYEQSDPDKRAIFADASWEFTSANYNGMELGDGYNVCFLDGHVDYYPRTGVQGRYRHDW